MNKLLKDPKKRRQILIAAGALAVLVLLLVLRKKTGSSESAGAAEPQAASEPPGPIGGGEGGGTGGGSGGGSTGGSGTGAGELGQIGTQISQQLAAQNAEQQTAFGALINALSGYSNALPGAGELAQAPTQARTPLAQHNLLKNEQANSPRKGDPYKLTTFKGKPAHDYGKPIKGGVGPNHSLVILNPRTKAPVKIASTSRQPSSAGANHQAGNPRQGAEYEIGKYKGKPVHIYTHAVKGGVGTRKNMIVV